MNKEEWAIYDGKEQAIEREKAIEVLNLMKKKEEEYKKTRLIVTEKTSIGGIRTKYIAKDGENNII